VNVRIRLFAAVRQAVGSDHVDVEMPDGATVGQLRRRLVELFPQLSDLGRLLMFAVGARVASDATPIPRDADVACIPPVSGG
jgi:molybdopterin synthase sulfur carrier subunit